MPGPQRREPWCLSHCKTQGFELSKGVLTKYVHLSILKSIRVTPYARDFGGVMRLRVLSVLFCISIISLPCHTRKEARLHSYVCGSISLFCLGVRVHQLLCHKRISCSLEQHLGAFPQGWLLGLGQYQKQVFSAERNPERKICFLTFKPQLHHLLAECPWPVAYLPLILNFLIAATGIRHPHSGNCEC